MPVDRRELRDAILATRRLIDTATTIAQLWDSGLDAGDDQLTHCALASYTALFGPDIAEASRILTTPETEGSMALLDEYLDTSGFHARRPRTASEFIAGLEDSQTRGALLVSDTHENGVGHIMAVVPVWIAAEDGKSLEPCFEVVDTASNRQIVSADDLGQLYAEAHLGRGGIRTILIFSENVAGEDE